MENVATEEFISRTEALEDFEACNAANPHWTPQRVKTLLLRQPAADVAPVVHGRWIDGAEDFTCGNHNAECSICRCYVSWDGCDEDFNYYPNCGAKMNGGFDDATS